ncbi:hypothetical protein [Nicoliella lavandulae]|uniref:Uncharacterized protein n=1 Tax=Nicoliella lavandulae TaxID=3082954 RepID=A0ABU8SLY4_9LACO
MDSNFLETDFNDGYRQAVDDSLMQLKSEQTSLTQIMFKISVNNHKIISKVFNIKHSEPYLKGYEEGLKTVQLARLSN